MRGRSLTLSHSMPTIAVFGPNSGIGGMSDKIISLTRCKSQAAKMLEDMHKTGTPVVGTQNGAAPGGVEDVESYDRAQRALLMMKLMVQGEADVREGALSDQDSVFAALEKKLEQKRG